MWYVIIAALGFGGGWLLHKPDKQMQEIQRTTDTILVTVEKIVPKIDTMYKYIPQIVIKQDTVIQMTGEVLSIVKKIDVKTDTLINRSTKRN